VNRFFGAVTWIGLAAGVASGLLGIGGAVIMVPLMVRYLHVTQHRAHGTSLAVVIFTASAALVGYARAGHIDLLVTLPLVAGSVVGSPLGARWASAVPAASLRRAFGLLVLLVGLRLLLPHLPEGQVIPAHGMLRIGEFVLLGGIVGVLSGFTGVGGGTVLVPALVLLAGIDQHQAQGISLLFVIPTAIAGGWAHQKLGNVDGGLVPALAVWSMLGGFGAAFVAAALPASILRIIFGVFLMLVGTRLLFFRSKSRGAQPPK